MKAGDVVVATKSTSVLKKGETYTVEVIREWGFKSDNLFPAGVAFLVGLEVGVDVRNLRVVEAKPRAIVSELEKS